MVDGASDESGFSLVELLVAMTITLIVSGAIYGLLAGGQNAFRREPELTERQQNIRMAMDLIMRDVGSAGVGMPPFVQVFRDGLDATTGSPMGPNSVRTDELEIITHGGRDSEPVCPVPAPTAQQVMLMRQVAPAAIPLGSVVILNTWDGHWTARRVTAIAPDGSAVAPNCIAAATGVNHTLLTFASSDSSGLNPGSTHPCASNAVAGFGNTSATVPAGCVISSVSFAEVVRYRVRNDADGVPVLQRSSSSRWDAGFQTIARGIEDLQVQYAQVQTPTTWVDTAPLVAVPPDGLAFPTPPSPPPPTAFGTLTRHVRVTLAARSEVQRVQGMQTSATAGTALRGSLTSTGSPRSALFHVARGRPASPAPPSPATWYWE